MDFAVGAAWATTSMVLQASPYILLGLLFAGLLHVLVPEALVLRWMGHPGLAGVARAGLIGVPLPVCSCGVVPITVELRRKGASEPAAQSFLITTPESSIDSILLTWGLMGPVLAIARPVAALFTAVLGGVLSIASSPPTDAPEDPEPHGADTHEHAEQSGAAHHLAYEHGDRAREALRNALFGLLALRRGKPPTDETEPPARPGLWTEVARPALRYGFVELLDDLAFWLLLGILLAGVLTAALPGDLGTLGLGTGILPMLALLVVGLPLYMCASASTPVAAVLMAKGVSPGAALVFLLAGPATNAATLLLLAGTFGRRFVRIYLVSVIVGALAAGVVLDALLGAVGSDPSGPLLGPPTEPGPWSWLCALVLVGLLVWRLVRGGWRHGVAELRATLRRAWPPSPQPRGRPRVRRRIVLSVGAASLLLLAYLSTGLRTVALGSRGYGFLFGSLVWSDLRPGLHYVLPRPFGAWETRRTEYARKSDVGFRTDLGQLAERRELMRFADPADWHSPVAAMNADPERATYLTADESLVELSFSIHYALSEPAAFFFGIDHRHDFVGLYAEASARDLVGGMTLEDLLTTARRRLEESVGAELQARLDEVAVGVRVLSIQVVDVHPPDGAVFAFRDVSSAREDRETRIHEAHEGRAWELPRARGRAAEMLSEAAGRAARAELEAAGENESFIARADAVSTRPHILRHLLWLESTERTLSGRALFVLPPGSAARGITLWRAERSAPPKWEDR